MKTIRGYLFSTDSKLTGEVVIEKSLQGYYKALDCSTIDVVHATIGDREYDIICDDEGLLKQDYILTAINPAMNTALSGNILVVKFDGGEDFESINDEDVINIENNIFTTKEKTEKLADKLLGYL
jgi:hypothetical protein